MKKVLHHFTKKNRKKQIKNSLELSAKKVINYMLNGRDIIILLTVGLIKKIFKFLLLLPCLVFLYELRVLQ